MAQLTQRQVLGGGGGAFAEAGRPAGVYEHEGSSLVAVSGSFLPLQWHGRDLHAGLRTRHRVSLYDANTLRCVGVCDRAAYPVLDVAFHPSEPFVAIATGGYDGGYAYEGELIVWNHQTGRAASVLDRPRQIDRCDFDERGEALRLSLRPPDDEEESRLGVRCFRTELRAEWGNLTDGSVRVGALALSPEPAFDDPGAESPASARASRLGSVASARGRRFDPRRHTWDVAFGPEGEVWATREGVAIEAWSRHGDRLGLVESEAPGVQLLPLLDERAALVVLSDPRGRGGRVVRIEPGRGLLTSSLALDAPSVFSRSSRGYLLARAASSEPGGQTRDRLVGPDLCAGSPLDLGRYDLFNHYLRVDGAPHLYFLQGTPKGSHEDKWVCRLHVSGLTERLFPLEWDSARGGHLMSDAALFLDHPPEGSLLLSGRVHDGRGLQKGGAFVALRALPGGELAWRASFDSQVTALAELPGRGLVAAALTGGQIVLLDAATGETREIEPVIIGQVPGVALSLAASPDRLVAGTLDGRVIVYSLP